MKVAIIISWILWTFLFLAWPVDFIVVYLSDSKPPEIQDAQNPGKEMVGLLAFVGFCSLAFSFAVRWFFLRYVISSERLSPDSTVAAVLFVITSMGIWSLTKSVEIYGLILFLMDGSYPVYFGFWIPSIIIMIIHMPCLLDPRGVKPRPKKDEASNSVED